MDRRKKAPAVLAYGKGPKVAPNQSIGAAGSSLQPPVYPGTPLDSSLWARAGVWASVVSSRCGAIRWEEAGNGIGSLYITFKDGTTCKYDYVPQQMAEDLFNCTSMGAFVTQRLGGWTYTIV